LKEDFFTNNQQIPVGFVAGKGTRIYQNVLVLEDSGKNRIPPQFPGKKPDYLIDRRQLQTYWDSQRPVVFITDFLRDFQDTQDPISLNLPNNAGQSFLTIGKRQVYLNQAGIRNIKK
jgi:hypothetical protein